MSVHSRGSEVLTYADSTDDLETTAKLSSVDRRSLQRNPYASLADEDLLHICQDIDPAKKLRECVSDIGLLRQRQELMFKKQEEAEATRRGQLDSVSERVFKVEKDMRMAETERQEAIEKASATFSKQHNEMKQDRHNLLCAITQVNQNFEQVTQDLGHMQTSFETLSTDVGVHGVSVAGLQRGLLAAERSLASQEAQLRELQAAVQSLHETVRQAMPQVHSTSLTEVDTSGSLATPVREAWEAIRETPVREVSSREVPSRDILQSQPPQPPEIPVEEIDFHMAKSGPQGGSSVQPAGRQATAGRRSSRTRGGRPTGGPASVPAPAPVTPRARAASACGNCSVFPSSSPLATNVLHQRPVSHTPMRGTAPAPVSPASLSGTAHRGHTRVLPPPADFLTHAQSSTNVGSGSAHMARPGDSLSGDASFGEKGGSLSLPLASPALSIQAPSVNTPLAGGGGTPQHGGNPEPHCTSTPKPSVMGPPSRTVGSNFRFPDAAFGAACRSDSNHMPRWSPQQIGFHMQAPSQAGPSGAVRRVSSRVLQSQTAS